MLSDAAIHGATLGIRYFLGALLAITVAITVERIVTFRRHRSRVDKDAAVLSEYLAQDDVAGAIEYFSQTESVAGQMTTVALRYSPKGGPAVKDATSGAALLARERLERGLTILATLGNNAPFLGLLGTVLGIVAAFASLGQNADNGVLMAAISEALIATAIGLVVALPAVVAYNHLQRYVDRMLGESEALCHLVAAHAVRDDDGR